jgi:hypothetical protein
MRNWREVGPVDRCPEAFERRVWGVAGRSVMSRMKVGEKEGAYVFHCPRLCLLQKEIVCMCVRKTPKPAVFDRGEKKDKVRRELSLVVSVERKKSAKSVEEY